MGIICISKNKNKRKKKISESENEIIKINNNNNKIKDKIDKSLDKVTNINDKTNVTMDKTEIDKYQKEQNDINNNKNNVTITDKNTNNITQNNDQMNIITNDNENNLLFSIRDEFNSNTNRNIPYSPHTFDIVNNRGKTNDNLNDTNINNDSEMGENKNSLTYRNESIVCIFCSQIFNSIREYEQHFNICSLNHRQNISNSINVNNILRPESNLLALLGLNEIDEQKEYINWVYNNYNKIWENKGKVYVTKDEMNDIDKKDIIDIKNEKIFYKKRIWFRRKMNNFILDNTKNNPPLVISRKNIFEETYNQFMTSTELNLNRKIQIYFIEEVAHDAGGVEREWYSTLFKEIFSKENNFFCEIETRSEDKGSFFISNKINEKYIKEKESYYFFIGTLISKALLDKILIPYKLSKIILKYILYPKNDKENYINNIYNLEDIKYYDLEIYNSLKNILVSDLDNNEDIFFVWNINGNEMELIDNGKNILVKNNNKDMFINKVVELICYKSIKEELISLRKGFVNLIPNSYINIFNAEEFSFVLCGQSIINIKDWKSNTIYKGLYKEKSKVIELFWEVLSELNNEELLLFYKFCTGSMRVPIDGFSSISGPRNKIMKFTIETINKSEKNKLITAQTCFNSIVLPDYKTKEEMKKSINIILENDTNYFGLE